MMMRRLTALLALLWFGSFEAHAAQPSLSRRPVESRDRDAEVAALEAQAGAVAASVKEDTALAAQVATFGAKATAANRDFDQLYGESQRSVTGARGASVGSEAWVVAENAISRLDVARFDAVTSLASLDSLYSEKADAQGDSRNLDRAAVDAATIDRVRLPVMALVDSQNDRLDALKGGLKTP